MVGQSVPSVGSSSRCSVNLQVHITCGFLNSSDMHVVNVNFGFNYIMAVNFFI